MFTKVLVANRGEIAIRIARALHEMEIASVAVYGDDDAQSLHLDHCDEAFALNGKGVGAYLDMTAIINAARASGCDAIHPGYGFLSENADFAEACANNGITFIGPSPATLKLLGDKGAARQLAQDNGIPLAQGTLGATTLIQATALMQELGGKPMMIKALAGGGGRGMRIAETAGDLPEAFARAASEAKASFGEDALYLEELLRPARHIEVQIIGDASGEIAHLYERECSLQRRNQKLVEFAPAPGLDDALRERIVTAAVTLGKAAGVQTLCTMEFLLDTSDDTGRFVFMEANPRLQVEHTVTEEVMGIDLVQTQIALAAGVPLADLALSQGQITPPRGFAVQLRINMEQIDASAEATATGGTLAAFEPPSGAGVRVDTFGYTGYTTNTRYDSLLAKVIAHVPSGGMQAALSKGYRALCEFKIDGVLTNLPFLQALITDEEVVSGRYDTGTVARLAPSLLEEQRTSHPFFNRRGLQSVIKDQDVTHQEAPDGTLVEASPMGGILAKLLVDPGDSLRVGQPVAVIEAMKMEHLVHASRSGSVASLAACEGDSVHEGNPLFFVAPADLGAFDAAQPPDADDPSHGNEVDLTAWRGRIFDASRHEAVAKQHARGLMTARERIAALADAGSFVEIGGLARNLSTGETAPADGVIVGSCRIDGRPAFVMSQDFTVMGGSAGHVGDAKMVRVAKMAVQSGVPLVMILDGGGHRIQDGQSSYAYAGATPLFQEFARLSGWVPVVAAVMGFGFAANTNFAAMADYVVMLRDKSTMGLAGPALVKAGTGETISAMDLGGAAVQVESNGLADGIFDSETESFDAIRAFLSYLPSNAQAPAQLAEQCDAPDQSRLSDLVPANTRKAYDMRQVVEVIADSGSVFEFKSGFAKNIITGFARLQGRPVGFIANQPLTLAGMLDAAACEKAARFITLCDAFGLPLVYLVDIPGMSIGSAAEKTMLGRRSAKMLFALGHATVPRVSVVLRKGYGLGYLAMAGGRSFDADGAFAWPTAEICAMSIEGSVDVAFRKQFETAGDPAAKRQELIDEIRSRVGPLQAAEGFGIDDLIAPDETRQRIVEVLSRSPARRNLAMPPKIRAIPPI